MERIKDHAEENPRYRCDAVEMQEIKENWYWLEAAYQYGHKVKGQIPAASSGNETRQGLFFISFGIRNSYQDVILTGIFKVVHSSSGR